MGDKLTHQDPPDQKQGSAEKVPRFIVTELPHECAVGQNRRAQNENIREEADGSLDSGVTAGEDEVDGDVVDWDKASSGATGGCQKEKHSLLVEDHVQGKQPVRFGCTDLEGLLGEEYDPDERS